jgi:predicted dehydrogenase
MKIALIGLGNAGASLHLPALAGLSGADVTAVCDMDPARRDRTEREYGVRSYEDLERLLVERSPDVVVIGTPPESHAEISERALAAGAHVICEKPFAPSLEEADRIIAAADRAGRRVALNHEFREMPIFRALRDQVGRPEVGDLRFAHIWQAMDLPPWKEAGWRADLLEGTLYEAGIHLIDYAIFLFGERPTAIGATMSSCTAIDERSDAVALVTLEFPSGRLAQVTQNRLSVGDTQYLEVRAECSGACLRASFGGRARLSLGMYRSTRPHLRWEWGASGIAWLERGSKRSPLARNPKDPAMLATRALFEKTLRAFRDGSRPPATAEDGRLALEVVTAAYEAARSGVRTPLAARAAAGVEPNE